MPKKHLATFVQDHKIAGVHFINSQQISTSTDVHSLYYFSNKDPSNMQNVRNSNVLKHSKLLLTAGNNGALIYRISALPLYAISATNIFLFLQKAGMIDEERFLIHVFQVQSNACNSTNLNRPIESAPNITHQTPLRIDAGDSLYVAINNSQGYGLQIVAEYSDF